MPQQIDYAFHKLEAKRLRAAAYRSFWHDLAGLLRRRSRRTAAGAVPACPVAR